MSPPSHPADFDQWVSGKSDPSNRPGWAWHRTPAGVTVGPAHGKGIAVCLFAMAMFGGLGVMFIHLSGGNAFDVVRVMFGLISVAVAVLFGFLTLGMVRDQAAGPYLLYRVGRREFALPRAGLVVPRSSVRGFRTVTGNRMGPRDHQVWRDGAHSELHLIVDTPAGPTAYLICGWLRASLDDSLRELARAIDLPLAVVTQPDVRHGTPQLPTTWD